MLRFARNCLGYSETKLINIDSGKRLCEESRTCGNEANRFHTYTFNTNTMKLQTLTPNMLVNSVNETVNWYKENLGFQLLMSIPEEGEMDWAMVQRDEVSLMFQTRKSLADELALFADIPIGGSLSFFTKLEGLGELHEMIVDKSAIIKKPYETFYGMKEFMVKDCNGYYLTFAEEIEKKE